MLTRFRARRALRIELYKAQRAERQAFLAWCAETTPSESWNLHGLWVEACEELLRIEFEMRRFSNV